MGKQDYKNASIYNTLATATTKTEEPKEELKRINLALDPALHNFLMILAKSTGSSMNAFINKVLQQYMDDHRDSYDLALKLMESLERK